MDAFRHAVESRDLAGVESLLADDVVFHSPVAFQPYPGKAVTAAILREVIEVFEDFTYVRELHDDAGGAYVFTATVDGLELTGCDFLELDSEGRITDFMVMVRPLKAAQALAARMAERYPAIVEAAAAWTARD
ncbi:nuclear transport factor 2 family protein [Nocardioides sp. Y6]|uniref:Nuclear transport factor 2 family protein n=2 Tax=Nocardioides malaquae TaxID=2773426 RepID=A0ABR9RQ29_9ACTN|nr:nuclear transport factor 2 family protein [Nocardioides malaquae]